MYVCYMIVDVVDWVKVECFENMFCKDFIFLELFVVGCWIVELEWLKVK